MSVLRGDGAKREAATVMCVVYEFLAVRPLGLAD